MITVRLCGGLGNQLFQYAVGRVLSIRWDVPLVLDVSSFASDRKRTYMLAPYHVPARVVSSPRWRRWLAQVGGRYRRERGFAFDPQVLAVEPGSILDGYFQSEKYFAAHAKTIRDDLSLKEPLSAEANSYLQAIEAAPVSVAVHVRRGDYVADSVTRAYHGVCEWDYYEEAMARLRQRLGEAHFFFFSDDPAWLVERMTPGTVVQWLPPHEDLFLMSRCRHQIIANSSFSWWGAWLNQNPQKIVIAPRRWFANEKMEQQTGDLIPEGWERI